jgi:hypothetical protein
MRMCGSCGATNVDTAEFCGGCGAFLEFDEASSQPGDAARPGGVAPAGTAPADPTVPVATVPAGADPVATVPAEPTVPAVVQPDEAVTRRHRTVEVIDDRPKPGDILCPSCGAGNTAERRFCRRCACSLSGAALVRVSWWRRLRAALRGKPLAAGSRPRRRRRSILPTALLLALIAVVVASLPAVRPSVLRAYDTARGAVLDRFSQPTEIVAKSATASSSMAGVGPQLLIDGANDTYWAPKPPAPARDEWCRLQLDRPTYVAKLLITAGIDTKEDVFRTQARPSKIEITIRRDNGTQTVRTVSLNDRPNAQEINIRAGGVVQMTFTIKDAYGVQPGRRVAIAEIEVFARK